MGLTPAAFWDMTPYEFKIYVEGRGLAFQDERWHYAVLASWILSAISGKRVSPARLMGTAKAIPVTGNPDDIRDFFKKPF